MLIDGRPLWLAQTNTWVVAPEPGGLAVVIDAPPDASGVIDLLGRHKLTPAALLLTHGHVDHAGGAGQLVRSVPVTTYVHPDDDFLTLDPTSLLRMLFGMIPPGDYEPPDTFTELVDGDRLRLASVDFDVLHTPGHTPGHCCFSLPDEGVLFSGDQLFAGSIGRTDLPGGDTDQLMESMRSKVMPLDDDVRVLPGHGPETTIGFERSNNPFRSYWL
jgi:glyoxylase-like metal-dependent hydrolase (beta-lactamase superfamily II)